MHPWLWDIIKYKIDKGQSGTIKGKCTTLYPNDPFLAYTSVTPHGRLHTTSAILEDFRNFNNLHHQTRLIGRGSDSIQ